MKTFYAEYVNHILRYYTRNPGQDRFRSEADKLNHIAAERVFEKLSEKEKALLTDVYARNDPVPDSVCEVAGERGMDQDEIWTLIGKTSNKIAKGRKLI
jgi:hypothetical protein